MRVGRAAGRGGAASLKPIVRVSGGLRRCGSSSPPQAASEPPTPSAAPPSMKARRPSASEVPARGGEAREVLDGGMGWRHLRRGPGTGTGNHNRNRTEAIISWW